MERAGPEGVLAALTRSPDDILATAPLLARARIPIVIDHYGLPGAATPESAHGRALLDLLRKAHAAFGGLVLVAEIVLEELLELRQHGLEDPAPGVGVGLDHLHHAFDFLFHRDAGLRGIALETQHARPHAVDELAYMAGYEYAADLFAMARDYGQKILDEAVQKANELIGRQN